MSSSLYHRILCTTDFSEAARAPVQEALRFAALEGVELTLLHVIHGTALDGENDPEIQDFHKELEQKARQQMEELVPPSAREGVHCTILRGNPVEEVLRAVRKEEPDLLIIGSHGITGIGSNPMGSTSHALVLLCPVPVLIVKPEGYRPEIPTG